MIYITYIYLPIDAIASKNVVQQNADFPFGIILNVEFISV